MRKPRLNLRLAIVVAVLATCAAGCVQRRMTIRSNPPGAQVFVDDYEIGTTPVSTSFTYYGSRKIRLVKDGYETLTTLQPVYPPWYEIPPLDFFSENVVPGKLRDERAFDFQLRPQILVPPDQLLARAEELRRGTQQTAGVAAPGLRINAPAGSPLAPPPGMQPAPEVIPPGIMGPSVAPPPVGGQPSYPLPPGR